MSVQHESINQSYVTSHDTNSVFPEEDLREHLDSKNCYFRLASLATKSPWKYILPISVYLLMSPAIYVLFKDYQYSMDFTAYFPTDSSSVKAYNEMLASFPPSDMMPYYVLGVTEEDRHGHRPQIWTESFFRSMCDVTRRIIPKYNMSSIEFHSVAFAPNVSYSLDHSDPTKSNWSISQNEIFCFDQDEIYKGIQVLYQNGSAYLNESGEYWYYYEYIESFLDNFVSESQTASLISFTPPFNPLLSTSIQPSRDLRDLVDDLNKEPAISNVTKMYVHSTFYWQVMTENILFSF